MTPIPDKIQGFGPLIPALSVTQRPLRLQIFERVRGAGSIARIDIAKQLSISPATVTAITADLIKEGLVTETAQTRESGRGRPPVAIGVRSDAHLVAGIKLSDRQQTALIADFAGNVIASTTRAYPAPFPTTTDLIDLIDEMLTTLCDDLSISRDALSAIGIGVPGFVDHQNGTIRWTPLLDEQNIRLAEIATSKFNVPTIIDNDANLATLAELWFGSGRDKGNFAVVTIEHGVGMGLVANHRLYRGSMGLGMELGHTKVQMDGALCRCGQRGCLEAYVADYAIIREAETALNMTGTANSPRSDILDTLYAQAKDGNTSAQMIFKRAGRYLALGLANVVNLFDPEHITLSGARMRYELLYADDVLKEMRRMIINTGKPVPNIEVHAGGDLIWAQGAAALALEYLSEVLLGQQKEIATQ